jgi:hypothetical protein
MWFGKPPEERDEGPRCGECQSRDVEETEAGPGFDPDAAVGGSGGGQTDQLREALQATPGVGASSVDYCVYWFENGVDGPSELHDLLCELGSVDQNISRRIVQSIYGEGDTDDAPAPFAVGGGADGDADGGTGDDIDTLDAIIKAKQAGLIDADDDGGVDSAEVADAVASAIEPSLNKVASAVAASQDGDNRDEIQALREEVEQLRKEKEKSKLNRLEEKIESLEQSGDPDNEILRLKQTREMLENAPSVSADAADSWGELAHSILDRMKSMERQRAMLGAPGADDRQPQYDPAPPQRGQPAPAPAAQQRPSPPQATADGGHRGGGSQAPADGSDDESGALGDKPTDPEKAEKSRKIRQNLGLAEEEDSE